MYMRIIIDSVCHDVHGEGCCEELPTISVPTTPRRHITTPTLETAGSDRRRHATDTQLTLIMKLHHHP